MGDGLKHLSRDTIFNSAACKHFLRLSVVADVDVITGLDDPDRPHNGRGGPTNAKTRPASFLRTVREGVNVIAVDKLYDFNIRR
jgi:hypothetical protein